MRINYNSIQSGPITNTQFSQRGTTDNKHNTQLNQDISQLADFMLLFHFNQSTIKPVNISVAKLYKE